MRKTRVGQELIEGMDAALDHVRGARRFREALIEIPAPARRWRKDEIADLRKRVFHASQPEFASILSVKVATIRAWEQGLKRPSGAACRLLEVAALQPMVFQHLREKAPDYRVGNKSARGKRFRAALKRVVSKHDKTFAKLAR